VGGLLGFLAILYLVPHMESIVSLVLLTAAVSALAGWVAAGSERIAYAGLQIAFAFFMCLFQGFAPDTNFTTIRDRLVGIVLGIVVSSIIFRHIWPERAVDRLRAALGRALRNLAGLLPVPRTGESVETEKAAANRLRGEIAKDLDAARKLSELAVFEEFETGAPDGPSAAMLAGATNNAQAVCLVATVLSGEAALEQWQGLAVEEQTAELALRAGVADQLRRVVSFMETGASPKPAGFASVVAAWRQAAARPGNDDRRGLLRQLIDFVNALADGVP
jgi:multidrug resistance protein MdtO